MNQEEFWIELPALSPHAPRRLIIFLHAAGATTSALVPFAVAWQRKFPGATAALLAGNIRARQGGREWFATLPLEDRTERVELARKTALLRIEMLQRTLDFLPNQTILVGWSQGATLAIELARCTPTPAAIVVAYASQLARPLQFNEPLLPTFHLLHGELDSVVPVGQGQKAWRSLRAAGADVTLDVMTEAAHELGPGMVSLGTTRVMQTLFRGRHPANLASVAALH